MEVNSEAPQKERPSPQPASWREVLGVYVVSLLVVLLVMFLGQGPLKDYRGGLIGATYLFLPNLLCRRKSLPLEEYAPLERPTLRALLLSLLFVLLTFPAFWLSGAQVGLVPPFRSLSLPEDFFLLVMTQFLVVAIPEELFFRGYIQRRLDDLITPKWRLFGVQVGASLLLSSLMFAFAHFLSPPNPSRLLTFFPGLAFGFLRAATQGIWAGVLFHGLCNLFLEVILASAR